MEIKDIEKRLDTVAASVKQGRLDDAYDRLEEIAALVRAPWAVREQLRRSRENYKLMCDYAMTGGRDDSREQRYDELRREAIAIGDIMLREARATDTPTLYYSTLRFERTRPADMIASIMGQYGQAVDAGIDVVTTESLETRLFNRVWVTYPLSDGDAEALRKGIVARDSSLPIHARRLILSAIMLGGMEWSDRKRMDLLLEAYMTNDDTTISLNALSAAVLMALANDAYDIDFAEWAKTDESGRRLKDLKLIVRQITGAYDTERIRKKMNDEVLPELMKLKPEIDRRISELTRDAEGASPDISSIEENPEWEKMMNNSGLADKLREMNDLQMEGADVMMSTFAALKTFPFFNDPSNWFMPFHSSHSIARKAGDKAVERLSRLVQAMPMFCDSDKFSLLLLAGHMGGVGFSNMLSGLEEQADMLNEAAKAELDTASKERVGVVRRYIQDLYRFFKLYRRKGEFKDPFARVGKPLESKAVRRLFTDDSDMALATGEFYFKRSHYAESLPLLQEFAATGFPTPEVFQKIGYAMQRTGNIDGALEMYQNSDLLKGDSLWTLRRIGSLLRASGRSTEAAGYLKRAYEIDGENIDIVLALAGALLESGQYKDALNLYYKADYLRHGEKTMRLIAWCLLMAGEYERCREAYDNLGKLPGGYKPTDLLNIGHLDMIFNRYAEAAEHYASAIADYDFDIDRFESELAHDRAVLEEKGVPAISIDLVADRARQMARGMGERYNQ